MTLLPGMANHYKWLTSRKPSSVEELDILPAGAEPRISHHRPPGGERGVERGSVQQPSLKGPSSVRPKSIETGPKRHCGTPERLVGARIDS